MLPLTMKRVVHMAKWLRFEEKQNRASWWTCAVQMVSPSHQRHASDPPCDVVRHEQVKVCPQRGYWFMNTSQEANALEFRHHTVQINVQKHLLDKSPIDTASCNNSRFYNFCVHKLHPHWPADGWKKVMQNALPRARRQRDTTQMETPTTKTVSQATERATTSPFKHKSRLSSSVTPAASASGSTSWMIGVKWSPLTQIHVFRKSCRL